MKKKLTLEGWNFINELAEKYKVNDGVEIDDSTLGQALNRLVEINLDGYEKARLGGIFKQLYGV